MDRVRTPNMSKTWLYIRCPQPTEWQRIGNQIEAAFVASFGELMNTSHPTLFYVSK